MMAQLSRQGQFPRERMQSRRCAGEIWYWRSDMNLETGKLKPGQARHPAETTQEIIARDKVEAPGWVRSESYEWLGDEDIDTQRYIDPAVAKEEFERLWTRTWQF